jgi:uncharacterized protein YdeI (YjbR/CyaY-like superfamily)
MSIKPNTVNDYLLSGCGRCSLGNTPECKVHKWQAHLKLLRSLAIQAGLTEEIKWSQPTYTFNGKNVIIVTAFNNYCCISFLQGSLIQDDAKLLEFAGPNSQLGKLAKFTSVKQITDSKIFLQQYLQQAIALVQVKAKPAVEKKQEQNLIPELLEVFKTEKDFEKAFKNLTPGKQRGYLIYFTGAKQSETRTKRIHQYKPIILQGKGMHDDYKKNKN